jgi:hypothetical protein
MLLLLKLLITWGSRDRNKQFRSDGKQQESTIFKDVSKKLKRDVGL